MHIALILEHTSLAGTWTCLRSALRRHGVGAAAAVGAGHRAAGGDLEAAALTTLLPAAAARHAAPAPRGPRVPRCNRRISIHNALNLDTQRSPTPMHLNDNIAKSEFKA